MIALLMFCYRFQMRQLIARINDELHAKLKAKAKAEGRSVNALVNEALEVSVEESREDFYRRLERRGWRVIPPQPERVPTDEELEESLRGVGTALSEALDEDREPR